MRTGFLEGVELSVYVGSFLGIWIPHPNSVNCLGDSLGLTTQSIGSHHSFIPSACDCSSKLATCCSFFFFLRRFHFFLLLFQPSGFGLFLFLLFIFLLSLTHLRLFFLILGFLFFLFLLLFCLFLLLPCFFLFLLFSDLLIRLFQPLLDNRIPPMSEQYSQLRFGDQVVKDHILVCAIREVGRTGTYPS